MYLVCTFLLPWSASFDTMRLADKGAAKCAKTLGFDYAEAVVRLPVPYNLGPL